MSTQTDNSHSSKSRSRYKVEGEFIEREGEVTTYSYKPFFGKKEADIHVKRFRADFLMPYFKYIVDYYNPVDEFWEKQRFFDYLYLTQFRLQAERRVSFMDYPIIRETGPYYPEYDTLWDVPIATQYPKGLRRIYDDIIHATAIFCHTITEEELHNYVMKDSICMNKDNLGKLLEYHDFVSKANSMVLLSPELQKYYLNRDKESYSTE